MSFLIFQISTLRSAEVSSFDIAAGARGDAWSRRYGVLVPEVVKDLSRCRARAPPRPEGERREDNGAW